MSEPSASTDCLPLEPAVASRKRTTAQATITNQLSAKRRRISLASIDLARELNVSQAAATELGPQTTADRFVTMRPKQALPLHSTPRTNRLARVFGLIDDRVMAYADEPSTGTAREAPMFKLLRRSASELFARPAAVHATSASSHLVAKCVLALDGPGMSPDPFAYPMSWSASNCIAVACNNDTFFQNLNTKEIAHLCGVTSSQRGALCSIQWGGKDRPDVLAIGTTWGMVQMWDANMHDYGPLRSWDSADEGGGVGGISWNENELAVGRERSTISIFDVRTHNSPRKLEGHKQAVLGVKWSPDGRYLASGDQSGGVYIWDMRALKPLSDGEHLKQSRRIRHSGPVKALAWCPWKPDLLASGSTYPEGKIRIWSASAANNASMAEPLHTIALNTSVMSLHWSPHCKELLSTHGSSFVPPLSPARLAAHSPRRVIVPRPSPIMHSITVHSYPACKRIASVPAHSEPVTHSCLGPDGTKLFTVSPKEEAMKMWKVWGVREEVEKRDSVFEKFSIR